MAEEELGFDPTLKKKKKKKKVLSLDGEEGDAAAAPTTEDAPANATEPVPAEEGDIEPDFGALKKKKKKKTKTLSLDGEEGGAGEGAAKPVDDLLGDLEAEFSLPAKKKKKKKPLVLEGDETVGVTAAAAAESAGPGAAEDLGRDYTYQELLDRVFSIMRAKNPDMVAGEKRRFVMKPPQVTRVGTRKSAFVNFTDICKMLHRQPDHLLQFLFAELGTSGSVDSSNALVIRGRFQQKQIESVLRRYIREYVTCRNCKSPDTILVKENRLHFMQCQTCRSRCSVASIKSGFQAVTGKRRLLRAKEG